MNEANTVSELSIIPRWARILAGMVFVACLLAGGLFMPPLRSLERSEVLPGLFFLVVAVFMGPLFAGLVLLTGYVNRDAKRRGMSAALWTLLVLVIPNGIGFIVYFLARQPLRVPCPRCGALGPGGASFCASCGVNVGPVCTRCGRGVSPEHAYCPHCGQALAVNGRVAQGNLTPAPSQNRT
jgi:RNA polymerase subunit RPABC4/transcription elongation factor Spt4